MADDGADRTPDEPSAGAVAAAALLLGAVALPVLGLRFLFGAGRDAETAPSTVAPTASAAPSPDPEPARPLPVGPEPAATPPAAPEPAPARPPGRKAAAPARDDVEAALVRLTDATVSPRRRRTRSAPKPSAREASLRPS